MMIVAVLLGLVIALETKAAEDVEISLQPENHEMEYMSVGEMSKVDLGDKEGDKREPLNVLENSDAAVEVVEGVGEPVKDAEENKTLINDVHEEKESDEKTTENGVADDDKEVVLVPMEEVKKEEINSIKSGVGDEDMENKNKGDDDEVDDSDDDIDIVTYNDEVDNYTIEKKKGSEKEQSEEADSNNTKKLEKEFRDTLDEAINVATSDDEVEEEEETTEIENADADEKGDKAAKGEDEVKTESDRKKDPDNLTEETESTTEEKESRAEETESTTDDDKEDSKDDDKEDSKKDEKEDSKDDDKEDSKDAGTQKGDNDNDSEGEIEKEDEDETHDNENDEDSGKSEDENTEDGDEMPIQTFEAMPHPSPTEMSILRRDERYNPYAMINHEEEYAKRDNNDIPPSFVDNRVEADEEEDQATIDPSIRRPMSAQVVWATVTILAVCIISVIGLVAACNRPRTRDGYDLGLTTHMDV